MFCYQCQETLKNQGCVLNGICGKKGPTADLQDVLLYVVKGVARLASATDPVEPRAAEFVTRALFTTVTNVNFDDGRVEELVRCGLALRDQLRLKAPQDDHDAVVWRGQTRDDFLSKARTIGVRASDEEEDVRSLRELLTYGAKGIAAYADHAAALGYRDATVDSFLVHAMDATTRTLGVAELLQEVRKGGAAAVQVMALLDRANTSTYGTPQITAVRLGVRQRPGILISGHDLKDMEELLAQTAGTGVDVYTHGEMLPAHYYPAFRRYEHLVGNYGNSWWRQDVEFARFNGPIVMTTNCLVPPKPSYRDRVFTTGNVGFPGVKHIPDRAPGGQKDFAPVIALARQCAPPEALEDGQLVGGFAHDQVLALADKILAAVRAGAIRKFVVMAGCDGRHKEREYYTEFARRLPRDTVILTAGCAKYRYNKLDLGEIDGIPRVLDAGQCNDSYSLALVALKLKEILGLQDINDLPIAYNVAWYEQKAVAVLLALLHLGVKNIHLGPTLPAFVSPGVAKVLTEAYALSRITEVEQDMARLLA